MKRKRREGRSAPATPLRPARPASAPRFGESVSTRTRTLLVAAGLVAAVFAVYLSVCLPGTTFFNLDDGDYAFANPRIQGGLTARGVAWAFTAFHSSNWHPLTWLSLQLDHELYGLVPAGFHFTNVLWHAANAVLLLLVLDRLTKRFWPSALVAALFALHPVRVESVAWIAERKDVLSGFFFIATLGLYGWYVEKQTLARYLLVLACFALGLMTKSMLVSLPFVLLLLDWWPLRRWPSASAIPESKSAGRLLAEKLPFVLLAAGTAYLTVQAQGVLGTPELGRPTGLERLLGAALAYWGYLWQTVWPVGLAPLYTRPTAAFPLVAGWTALGGLAVLTCALLWLGRQRPYLTVGWLWFLGTLVPVIGLVPIGIHTMADRYQYLPQIGLLLLLVWAADAWSAARLPQAWRISIALLILLLCASLTLQQALLWRDQEALWRHAVAATRDNFGAHDQLGQVLTSKGAATEAVPHLRTALQLQPDFLRARFHLGEALEQTGDFAAAADCFRQVLRQAPDFSKAQAELSFCLMQTGQMEEALPYLATQAREQPESAAAHLNLATALLYRQRLAEAEAEANVALRIDPRASDGFKLLGTLRALEGQPVAAERQFRAALAVEPDAGAAHGLAWALATQGKADAASELYRNAVTRYPHWWQPTAREAWLLATHPEPNRRNGPLAVLRAQMASQAAVDEAKALDVLAAAYAEAGRFPEAIGTARKALAISRAAGNGTLPSLANEIEVRLKRYEASQPWRDEALR